MDKESKDLNATEGNKVDTKDFVLKTITVCSAVFILVFAWKLLNVQFNIISFSFSDFLFLLLALFSVGLSAAFYYMASHSSELFYTNANKYMKDIAENIGRMDERISQRVTDLAETLNKSYLGEGKGFSESCTPASKEDLENHLKAFNAGLEEVTSLIKKDKKGVEVVGKLRANAQNITNAPFRRASELSGIEKTLTSKYPDRMLRFIKNQLIPKLGSNINTWPDKFLRNRVQITLLRENFPEAFKQDLLSADIIDSANIFTDEGIKLLRKLAANER